MSTTAEKQNKKKCSKATAFVAFAISGIAIGATAYYLFGTKDGRKTLNKAVDSVNDLSKTLKQQAEEGLEKASELAKRAKQEYERVLNLAEDTGEEFLDKAEKYKKEAKSLSKKGLKHAEKVTEDLSKVVDKA